MTAWPSRMWEPGASIIDQDHSSVTMTVGTKPEEELKEVPPQEEGEEEEEPGFPSGAGKFLDVGRSDSLTTVLVSRRCEEKEEKEKGQEEEGDPVRPPKGRAYETFPKRGISGRRDL